MVLRVIGWRKKEGIGRLRDNVLSYLERHSNIERMGGWGIEEKRRVLPPPEIRVTSAVTGNNPIVDTKHKRAEILIPQHLTEEEKQIVRDFYNL